MRPLHEGKKIGAGHPPAKCRKVIPPIGMVELRCRPILIENKQIAQCHPDVGNPCRTLLMRTRTKCLCTRPYLLNTQVGEFR